jgi:UDP-N-acetylmuramate: L-alanyl-gamma-D-glutamyl-meso-diaminopimelate ligase
LWAVFEPRSNTSQRNLFQKELGEALSEADGALLPPISAPEKFRPEDRLDPEAVVAAVRAAGKEAFFEPDVAAIIERLKGLVEDGDTIVVLSNGGFDGIHQRLLDALAEGEEP